MSQNEAEGRFEGPVDGGMRRAERAAPAASGLPCRNKNNCAYPLSSKRYRLKKTGTTYRGALGAATEVTSSVIGGNAGYDHSGRCWISLDSEGTWITVDGPSAAERKGAFALRRNVEACAAHYRRENCGFLTLTTAEYINPKEFARRWHKMRRRRLPWILSYIRVLEPQLRGAPHWHLLIATQFDFSPDTFDWEALFGAAEARRTGDLTTARTLTRRYAEKATPELRRCWAELRRWCSRYGLGRAEFLPFRRGAAAIAEYIGKYLEKGLKLRRDEWKGCRRVECDRSEAAIWRGCSRQFSWVSPGATAWRQRVGELARAVGAEDLDQLSCKLGRSWCYRCRGTVITADPANWSAFLDEMRQVYDRGEATIADLNSASLG